MKKVFAILAITAAVTFVACNNDSETKGTVDSTANAMKDSANQMMDNMKDSAGQMMDNMKDSANKAIDAVKDSAASKM